MDSLKSSNTLNYSSASRMHSRTMTLAQSNSKLIYDGANASLFLRVDSKLNKMAVNSIQQSLSSTIKGDLKFMEFADVKQMNKIDYKRQLISIVVSSEDPQHVKYLSTFMKNQQHQESFYVIFKCDTKEVREILKKIDNPRLRLVTADWDEVQAQIQQIYTKYYKKLVQFKGENKVQNKYYYYKNKDTVLNVYYPSKFQDLSPYIHDLQKRGSKSFKSIHFVKYQNYTDIIKRDVIRTKTKKTMTKMLTQSHLQMQASKPQETAMKEIAAIENKDKNLILANSSDVKQLEQIIRDKPNYEIVVLDTEKERETFFRGFLKCYKDISQQDPIIICHRLILLISEEENQLLQYAHELTEVDQTIGVAVYSGTSSLVAELFLVGQNSNNFGLLICEDFEAQQYAQLIEDKQIKNVKMIVVTGDSSWGYEPLVSAALQTEDQLSEYLESIIEQRQQYFDPVRGVDGQRIHIYFPQKQKQLISFVQQGILGKKRLQVHDYNTMNDLQGYIQQTISVDGVLIVCAPSMIKNVLKKTKDQKNVKIIVLGDQKEAQYNPQIINYCEDKQVLLNFLLNIPDSDDMQQSISDLVYQQSKSTQKPFVKLQQYRRDQIIYPSPNKPLVYIRLPNKLQQGDSITFEQRMKSHIKADVMVGIYERIEDIRNLNFQQEPLSFVIGTDNDMKWIQKFSQCQQNSNFEILMYTSDVQKTKKLIKYPAIKLVTSSFLDIENYILGRIEAYQTALYGPVVQYQYGNFPINQNDTVVMYYPSKNQKLKLELESKRAKSQFINMAMLVPYDSLTDLKKSLKTYSKNTKILIYADEMNYSGCQMALQGMLRQFTNPNFAIVSQSTERSIASYCKYSSNRLKKCITWIQNIPVSKIPKKRVSLKRISKSQKRVSTVQKRPSATLNLPFKKPNMKPVQLVINKIDPNFIQARDISLWNTKLNNVKYSTYIGNQQLLSLQNRAMLDSNRKYFLFLDEQNVSNHLNIFKNSCVKLIVQNNSQKVQSIKHQNIVYQGSPERVNSFLMNPFRDRIEYPPQFYTKNIRVLASFDLIPQHQKTTASSNGFTITTYYTPQQLASLSKNNFYDIIVSKTTDNADPYSNRVVLADNKNITFQERIPYQFVGGPQQVLKYVKMLSHLKKIDLKSLHDSFRDRKTIFISGFSSKQITQRNYTLVENNIDPDIKLQQKGVQWVLLFKNSSKHLMVPTKQYAEYILESIPNYNKQRLLNNPTQQARLSLFFEDKNLMRQVHDYFGHTQRMKYQPYNNSYELEKYLSYNKNQPSFIFTSNMINKNSSCENINQVVITQSNNNKEFIQAITADVTIKRIINSLKFNQKKKLKITPQTLYIIPEQLNEGELSFLASSLQNSTQGLFQIQSYKSIQTIPDIACTNLYVVTSSQDISKIAQKVSTHRLCSSKNVIVKVQNQVPIHKELYRQKYVEFVTDNQSEICQFILTNNNEKKYRIQSNQFLIIPDYYKQKMMDRQKSQKNIQFYKNETDIQDIIQRIPKQVQIFVVLNKFTKYHTTRSNIKIFYQGSSKLAIHQQLSALTPSRILKMFIVEQPIKKIANNNLSEIQFSYTLNKKQSSRSLKSQIVGSQPQPLRQLSRSRFDINSNYQNQYYTTFKTVAPSKQTVYHPLKQINIENQYYTARSMPQSVRQIVLQPANFPGKYTKNPRAQIVVYNSQQQLRSLIARFSSDPFAKVTIQRFTRFQQYQIPVVPPNLRPALVEYVQNQLNSGKHFSMNMPDFNSEYYPPEPISTFSFSDATPGYKQQSTISNINIYSSISNNLHKQKKQMGSNIGNKPLVYYKLPQHKYIPTYFDQEVDFKPYYTADELLKELKSILHKPRIIVIEQDNDAITIQNNINGQNTQFIRILRSDFNSYSSLPNTGTVLLQTPRQQSVIEWIGQNLMSNNARVNEHLYSSLEKKDSFSQLSTNLY